MTDETVEEIFAAEQEIAFHDAEAVDDAAGDVDAVEATEDEEPVQAKAKESPLERLRRIREVTEAAAAEAAESAEEDTGSDAETYAEDDDLQLTETAAVTEDDDQPSDDIPAETSESASDQADDDISEGDAEEAPAVSPRGRSNPLAYRLADLARRKSYIRMPLEGPSVFDTPEERAAREQAQADDEMMLDDANDTDGQEDATIKSVTQILAAANTGSGTPAEPFDPPVANEPEPEVAPEEPEDVLVLDDSMIEPVADEDEERPNLTTLILRSRDALGEHTDTLLKAAERAEEDDDFDLGAEIAKVEAEIAARNGNQVARHGLPRHVEDAMSRIFTETNQHLEDPNARRNRDAFAQLKAAVAATEAAKKLGEYGEKQRASALAQDDDDDDDYDAPPQRSREASVPPLKLVKSDLVTDTEDALDLRAGLDGLEDEDDFDDSVFADPQSDAAATPSKTSGRSPLERPERVAGDPNDPASIRLRKIAATKDTGEVEGETGFDSFATEMGAKTNLVDMMEAAGAYLCFEVGETEFSRPQIIKMVQQSIGRDVRREDGLRCFGRLLRQGRFTKTDSGRFQVSADSKFGPNAHRASGS